MKTKTIPMLIFAFAMLCGSAQGQTNETAATQASSPPPKETAPPGVAPVEASAVNALPPQAAAKAAVETTNSPSEEQLILINPTATLPEAIQTLARAAGINFLFDPKLVNQVSADGKLLPPPVVGVEIRWEKVTPEQALKALLDNYGWQLVHDKKNNISRVTEKDLPSAEPLITSVIQLQYANATNVQAQLTNTLSARCRVIPDVRTSQIIIMATEKEVAAAQELIAKIDSSTKQVLIEAKLLETSKNPKSVKGIDWTDTLSAQNVSFGNGVTASVSTDVTKPVGIPGKTTSTGQTYPGSEFDYSSRTTTKTTTTTGDPKSGGGFGMDSASGFSPSVAFLSADGVHAVLSFLNTDADTESLALPRSVAQDGVQTELAVIRNVPVFEQQQSAGAAGGANLATAKPRYDLTVGETIINEVGVKLKVTPRIVGVSNVFLDLKPEISSQEILPAHVLLNGEANEAPIFSRRKIITQATVPSGHTLVIGGLNNDSTSKTFTKVPILGDIPLLGLLFRHDSKERNKQNLMIFVTPTIIQNSDFQETKTDFLKTKFVPLPDPEESPLDTGKPKDWTKPRKTDSAS